MKSIGDRVEIKRRLRAGKDYLNIYAVRDMQQYRGKKAMIVGRDVEPLGSDVYFLDIDKGKHAWTEGMFTGFGAVKNGKKDEKYKYQQGMGRKGFEKVSKKKRKVKQPAKRVVVYGKEAKLFSREEEALDFIKGLIFKGVSLNGIKMYMVRKEIKVDLELKRG